MSRPVKYIALILVVAVVLGAVTGIAYWTAKSDPDAPNPGLFLDGKKVEEPPTMLTIGENEVSFSLYRHYFLMFKGYFEQYYGATFYNEDPDGDRAHSLKQMVEVELKNAFTWLSIAKEMGLELNEEDLAEIETTLAEQKETYGTGFAAQLQDLNYLDENNYREVAKLQALVTKAQTEYRAQLETDNNQRLSEEADKAFLEETLRAKHILISVDTAAEDVEAAKAEALAKAEGILAEIRASEDPIATFEDMMTQHTEDPGLAENPEGYTFREGEMVEIFYETTRALAENEISEPVLSESDNYTGFHIILRLPLTDALMEENRTTAIGQALDTLVTERQTAVEETLTITRPDFYGKITADSIR